MTQRLRFSARYEHIASACDFIAEAAVQAGFNEDAVFQIQLACDEACTNIIEHAYRERQGEIEIAHTILEGQFVITIRDQGHAFDPTIVPNPQLSLDADDIEQLKVGGLGLHFMRRLMDEVIFSFEGKDNTLTMRKRLP